MPSRFKTLFILVFVVGIFLVGLATPAMAAQTDSSELVIITEDDVVTQDLYALANRVIIRGVVQGDLIAIAGQDVSIEGEVTGSVMVLSPEVVVTGTIGGSLRATSPSILIEGSIGNDLVAVAGHIKISESGSVTNDVVLWAWNAELLGTIGGRIEGSQRNLDLAGEVGGDVGVAVRRLTIVGPLAVGGDLDYRSRNEAAGLGEATVDGAVVRQEPTPANIRLRAFGLVGRFVVAISLSALALLVVWAWPDRTQLALDNLKNSPIRSFLTGFVVMSSPLLLAGLGVLIISVAPTNSALPLVGAMIPVFLALIGLVFVLALVAGIPTAAWLGSVIRKNVTIAGAVGFGALVISVVWLIPVVGLWLALLILSFGLGAWIGSFRRPALET